MGFQWTHKIKKQVLGGCQRVNGEVVWWSGGLAVEIQQR